MSDLQHRKCEACTPNSPLASEEEKAALHKDVPEWAIKTQQNTERLIRHFSFEKHDFTEALAFTLTVGAEAEKNDHHPVLITSPGKVIVKWWTHAIGGLHQNDFIMAAKTDEIYRRFFIKK